MSVRLFRVVVAALAAALVVAPTASGAVPATSPVWSLAPVLSPHGTTIDTDSGPLFACPTATYCQLLTDGEYLTTLSGTTARTTRAPRWDAEPADEEALASVACERVDSCVAVGLSSAGPWDNPKGYREELANGKWTAEDGTDDVSAVACNAQRCVEIGTQDAGIDRAVLDDRTTGGSWTGRALITPWQTANDNGFYIGLNAARCTPSGPCYVLGHAQPRYDKPARSLLFSRHGRGWRGVPVAPPAGAVARSAYVAGALSCPASRICLAMGTYTDEASGDPRVFVATDADGVMTATPVPVPAGNNDGRLFADDLSCATATECAGLVTWIGKNSQVYQALLRYHAGAWSSVLVSPSGAPYGGPYVFAVACPSSTRCMAVGRSFRGTGAGLVESPAVWTSRASNHWTLQLLPRPKGLGSPDAKGELTTITCPAATRCFAGGTLAGKAIYGVANLPS